MIDNGLRTVKDTRQSFDRELGALADERRFRRLVELNMGDQACGLGKSSVVQQAWRHGRRRLIHGWVFDVASGHLHPQTPMIGDDAGMHAVCTYHGAA